MTELDATTLAQVAGGECYNAVVEVFGMQIGIKIGACQMS